MLSISKTDLLAQCQILSPKVLRSRLSLYSNKPGQDLETNLETPKPLSLLKKYRIALQIPGDNSMKLDFDDGVTDSDITYCFLGGKTWKQNVEAGLYRDDDAQEIELSSFKWLKDLFEILEVASDFDYERKSVARGLASWYTFLLLFCCFGIGFLSILCVLCFFLS
jgi:hypothetical protein